MNMSRFKKYSSTEVYGVAEMAEAKGLTLLEEVFGGATVQKIRTMFTKVTVS